MTNPKLAEIIYEAIEQWSCESDTKTEAIFKEAIQQAYELGREGANEQLRMADILAQFALKVTSDLPNGCKCKFICNEHGDFEEETYIAARNYKSARKGTGEVGA